MVFTSSSTTEFQSNSDLSDSALSPAISSAEASSFILRPIPRLSSSLLFIDSTVADYQDLVAGVIPGTEVHVLNSAQDAVSQITQVLSGRSGISSLHIVSHGEPGSLDFGAGSLNSGNLSHYSGALKSWTSALTATADVLLYGCDVAAGQGQAFVQQLAQLTGADVAASTDLTGSAALGGDWNLEFATGSIEAPLTFNASTLASYDSTLDPILAESFAGSDVSQFKWIFGTSRAGANNPFLTARPTAAISQPGGLPGGGTDTAPNGALRLTNNTGNQGSFVIYNQPINAASGLSITFDLYSYGGNGADGISFFLIDGSANPTTGGGIGGSLGYSSNSLTGESGPGIVGGYIGIGFDEYGNFSNTNYGAGGIGLRPDSVAIRGNEATNYKLLTSVTAPSTIDNPGNTATRTNSKRNVKIDITPAGLVTVQIDLNNNNIFETNEKLIDSFNVTSAGANNAPLPSTFKFGFGASTGGSINFHEINNFRTDTFTGAYVPLVQFNSTSTTVTENGSVNLTVNLDLPTSNTVTVPLTLSGTATNGTDYTIPTSVTIAPGQTSGTVTLTPIDDTIPEGDETAIVTLGPPTNAALSPQNNALTATITDNDGPVVPSFSIVNNVSRSEGTRGNKTYAFTVTLSQALGQAATVNFATADGTATIADNDYQSASGTLTFAAGEVSKTVNVTVLGDKKLEGTERFTVTLSNASTGTVITNAVGTGIIGDDDGNGPDFDLNGNVDFLWRNATTSETQIWLLNGSAFAAAANLPPAASEWRIEGYGDFNDDGEDDILWHNTRTLQTVIWLLNGPAFGTFAELLPVDPNYRVADIGDFTGDNKIDILWRNTVTGENSIWTMNGTAFAGFTKLPDALPSFTIRDAADFDGDGDLDLIWHNTVTGENSIWQLNNASFGTFTNLALSQPSFTIVDTADVDNDGDPDVLWHNPASGETVIWVMNGVNIQTTAVLAAAPGWTGQSILDIDRNGQLEILWRNYGSGKNVIWRLGGTAIASTEELLSAVPDWVPYVDD